MGFLDSIFGGSTEAETTQTSTLTPEQEQLLRQLTSQQQGLIGARGEQFGGNITPQAGQLSQQLFAGAPGLIGQSQQALGQLGQPLTAQALQQGSQPFLQSLLGQFQGQVVPQIASQFGALDSARSSGLGQAIGRQASQLPGLAQQQFLNQRNTGLQQGFQGLQAGAGLAGQQDFLNQLFSQGQFQNFLLGRQGANIQSQNLGTALGTRGFENIVTPGTQTQGIFGPLAGAFLGTEFGAGALGGLFG
ncbi:hypothetical protein LCGC14_0358300 [marine sediment metagenome]|uniref:Uncharacterized protein n=1 Tax=marine sediment metagenome TaxID=412755 RepID=A0A0F9TEK9_9ZZZZ